MRHHQESVSVTLVRCDTPFEMFRCRYVQQRFPPHLHETYAIGAIESGTAKVRYRGADVTFGSGDIIALEPHEVHTGEPTDAAGWSYRMLYLPSDIMARFGMDDVGLPRFAAPRYQDPELAGRLRSLHQVLEGEPDLLLQSSVLAVILHELCTRHGAPWSLTAPRVAPNRLDRVREYMEVHFARTVTLGELAAVAGISSFHLIRLFRSTYGLPPYAYFDQIRVNRAKEMIQQGAELSDVACQTGFSDQSHMTRRFKRLFGVPPGQYARSYWAALPRPRTRPRQFAQSPEVS